MSALGCLQQLTRWLGMIAESNRVADRLPCEPEMAWQRISLPTSNPAHEFLALSNRNRRTAAS